VDPRCFGPDSSIIAQQNFLLVFEVCFSGDFPESPFQRAEQS
jgi:hypothetical protein